MPGLLNFLEGKSFECTDCGSGHFICVSPASQSCVRGYEFARLGLVLRKSWIEGSSIAGLMVP